MVRTHTSPLTCRRLLAPVHVRRSIAEEASVSAHISGFGATKPQVSQLRTLKISDLEPSQVFRRSRAIAKRGIDAADLRTRLAKVERSLELAYLDRRQADVDAIESEAVRRLVDSLKDVPHACVRIGSIFLIKYEEVRGPVLVVRTLSPLEVHALERFPEVQGNPRTALEALATAVISLQSVGAEEKPLIP